METIKQKLNLIHLYSEHKVDHVGFFSLSSSRLGVREDYYGKLITRQSNESDLSLVKGTNGLYKTSYSSWRI